MTPDDVNARNRDAFGRAEVVADYRAMEGLTPCEERLVDRWVPAGAAILDLGVGTGRTTPPLAARASRYVGVDYAPEMVDEARRQHPGIDLRVGDASDLHDVDDASFDAVVFSYNGIDYLHPDEARLRCLAEVHRVLVPGGVFVFSTHNPRAIVARLGAGVRGGALRRAAVGTYVTVRKAARLVPTRAFAAGDGYVLDPARGGLVTHTATPARVRRELGAAGFDHRETRGGDEPRRASPLTTPWYYYVATRV